MEVEDSNTFTEPADDDFVIDPVEITLPDQPTHIKGTARKQKSAIKKKKSEFEENSKINAFYSQLSEAIEKTKEDILSSKINKLSRKLWHMIGRQKIKMSPFNIIKISMPANYQQLLRPLYVDFEKDQPQDFGSYLTVLNVDQPVPNLKDLIEFSVDEFRRSSDNKKLKKNTITTNERAIVVLFTSHLGLYQDFLDDYIKYISEEILNEQLNTKIFLVFPSLTAHTSIRSLETEIVELKFANTKKLVVKLLLNLIADRRFFPFLGSKVFSFLIQDLSYMNVSFERTVQKLHLLVQDFLFCIRDSDFAMIVLDQFINGENDDEHTYNKTKKQFREAFCIFEEIAKALKDKKSVPEYMLTLLTTGDVAYQLPSHMISKMESYEQIGEVCKMIEDIIKSYENPAFKYYVQKFAQLKNCDEETLKKATKSKNKQEQRQEMLLKGKGKSQKNDDKDNFVALRKEVTNYIRMFLKEGIYSAFNLIEEKFPRIVYNDTQRLEEISYIDILERYCRGFRDTGDQHPRQEMSMMFNIIQDFSFRINTPQSYESFVDLYKKAFPDMDKDETAKIFFVALNELKWLGLINETRKSQITFEKNFFAKALFRKPMNDNDDDDKDKDKD